MNPLNIFPLGSTSLLLLIVLVFLVIFFINESNAKSALNLPPSPTPLPLIGNLHQLDLKNFYKSLVKLANKYGSIYTAFLGSQKIVVLAGFGMVKDALINQADIFAGRYVTLINEATTESLGMVFSEGEMWRQLRRFTLSTLRDFGMGKKSIEEKIIEEAGFLVETFKSYNCQPFQPNSDLDTATANVIAIMLFRKRFDAEDETLKRFMKLVHQNNNINGSRMVQITNAFPFLKFLPGFHKKIIEQSKELKSLLTNVIAKVREELNENDTRNYVEAYLVKQQEEAGNPGSYFHDKNLVMLSLELFGAGVDTTSTSLRWSLLLMVKYPEFQKRVQEEIDQVIGTTRLPRVADRQNLPYTNAVIHEVLRFACVVPVVSRANIVETHLGGYFIPKRTHIATLLWSVLRDKTQWEKADEFDPSHFLNSEARFVKKDAFLPFGAGRRVCAGENLAKMELFLFFATLLQKFKFEAPANVTDLDITPVTGRVLAPKPFKLCAVPRG